MRFLAITTALLAMAAFGGLAPEAEAESFPSHLKGCRKAQNFERVSNTYVVPVVGGGDDAGRVSVVTRHYECRDTYTGGPGGHAVSGMKDASGKLVVPFAYGVVLPVSTTAAVVNGPGGYRTYVAGKGEGKERYEFQRALVVRSAGGCAQSDDDMSPGAVSAVVGEYFFGISGGRSHVTLFTPEGKARKLEYMGGEGLTPAVRRVGDVLVVRWRDNEGKARTGILDLHGRPLTPVLGQSALWGTPRGSGSNAVDSCSGSNDFFIEGPKIDSDPAANFFGPLLLPVGRDGQPAPMPKGAIGMFPAYPRKNTSAYSDSAPSVSTMWAVVFPAGSGFDFTLHVGTPSEARIAAATGQRYNGLARNNGYGGLVSAQSVTDGKWRTFRADSDTVVGDIDADLNRSLASADAILSAEVAQWQQAQAAAMAASQARRAEAHKKHWETARANGRLCDYRVNSENSRAEVEEYLMACGPGHFPGLRELARSNGIPEATIQQAGIEEWKRTANHARMQAEAEEAARIRRMQMANKNPGASYIPGQWESAIRNAGNSVVDDINKSSDDWQKQRRDQYQADWQRSQRAY